MLLLPACLAAETPQELLAAGRVDEAIETLEQQISTSPNAEAYNLLCRAHFELDNWDAGIPACEKAVSLEPENGLYHLWLGRIYGEKADRAGFLNAMGLAKKVRSEFERAVEFSPSSWEARTDLAEFYLEAPGIVGGGKDKARAQAELLAPLNPSMAHWVRGRIAERNKDNAAAEQEYRAAITASKGGARAWLNLAGFYRHADRIDEMDQALHSMESSPLDHPGAFVDGAGMLLRTGRDYPLGVRLLRRYVDSSNTVEEAPAFKAHCLLGELLEKQGDRTGAAEQYRAALAMAHSFGRARAGLQRVER
ncbi:MAG TPA: tetratricopeptide repeat protein [Candidatus Sulfotelmatobacter sp.]|nr:tetratricopeptide repeat protein [Candidatus Sulfotelmatobacter sp.]